MGVLPPLTFVTRLWDKRLLDGVPILLQPMRFEMSLGMYPIMPQTIDCQAPSEKRTNHVVRCTEKRSKNPINRPRLRRVAAFGIVIACGSLTGEHKKSLLLILTVTAKSCASRLRQIGDLIVKTN